MGGTTTKKIPRRNARVSRRALRRGPQRAKRARLYVVGLTKTGRTLRAVIVSNGCRSLTHTGSGGRSVLSGSPLTYGVERKVSNSETNFRHRNERISFRPVGSGFPSSGTGHLRRCETCSQGRLDHSSSIFVSETSLAKTYARKVDVGTVIQAQVRSGARCGRRAKRCTDTRPNRPDSLGACRCGCSTARWWPGR